MTLGHRNLFWVNRVKIKSGQKLQLRSSYQHTDLIISNYIYPINSIYNNDFLRTFAHNKKICTDKTKHVHVNGG